MDQKIYFVPMEDGLYGFTSKDSARVFAEKQDGRMDNIHTIEVFQDADTAISVMEKRFQ